MIKRLIDDLRLFSHDLAAILTIGPFVLMIWQQYSLDLSEKTVNQTVIVEITNQENKKL